MRGDKAAAREGASHRRLDVLERTVRYSADDYAMVSQTYSALDSKAQSTFGVSGLFLAGTVTLVNGLQDATSFDWGAALVVATYALLLAAIVASLVSLKVRDVALPMDAASMAAMALDVADLPDEELSPEVQVDWYKDQLSEWIEVAEDVERANAKKAFWLRWAQALLLIAIVLAGIATLTFALT